jgi:non-ribosomal peptide synthetase component F
VSANVAEHVLAELSVLGRSEGATLFMTALAAFLVLLHRHSAQHDFVVGTPVAGRTRPELEEIVGPFFNTLPLRCDLSGNPSFREIVRRVRVTALEAFEHQDAPLSKIVEAVQPQRRANRSPLFQVLFVVQNVPRVELSIAGLTVEALDVRSNASKFDMQLYVSETSNALDLGLDYDADLFDFSTMTRWLDEYKTIIAAAARSPDKRLDVMASLEASERGQGMSAEEHASKHDALRQRLLRQRRR